MMSNNLFKVVYGICDGVTFPCFLRLIFKVNASYKVQVLDNNELSLEEIDCELNSNEYIEITKETFLDISQPNYGIALSENEFICGTKEKIVSLLKSKIYNLDIYFRVEYFEFIEDYINLMYAYKELSNHTEASKQTKLWAFNEYRKIFYVVRSIEKVLNIYYLPAHNYVRSYNNFYIRSIQNAKLSNVKGFRLYSAKTKSHAYKRYARYDPVLISSISKNNEIEIKSKCLKNYEKSITGLSKGVRDRKKMTVNEEQKKRVMLILNKLLIIKD